MATISIIRASARYVLSLEQLYAQSILFNPAFQTTGWITMLQTVYNATLTANSAHQPPNVRFVCKDTIYNLTIRVLLVKCNAFNVQIQLHAKYALTVLSTSTLAPSYVF